MEKEALNNHDNAAWQEHYQLVRGNPTRIYEGNDFRLKKV